MQTAGGSESASASTENQSVARIDGKALSMAAASSGVGGGGGAAGFSSGALGSEPELEIEHQQHRVYKYDTIGEVKEALGSSGILELEHQLRADETPAFGKKHKSIVSELSESDLQTVLEEAHKYSSLAPSSQEAGGLASSFFDLHECEKESQTQSEEEAGAEEAGEHDTRHAALEMTQMSTISELSCSGAGPKDTLSTTTTTSVSRGVVSASSASESGGGRRYAPAATMSVARERPRSSIQKEGSVSAVAARTPRERSCDEVLKYSVMGKLDVEKTRMQGRRHPHPGCEFDLPHLSHRPSPATQLLTERKQLPSKQDPSNISLRASRMPFLAESEKENRIRSYEAPLQVRPGQRVLRRIV